MKAEQRREALLSKLKASAAPISATALAKEYGVSRQVVVGDIALLRAFGSNISATPRGYVLERDTGMISRTVATVHSGEDMERELNIMVDNGCTVRDVIVEHPIYGQITAPLQLGSRYEVGEFLRRVREEGAAPLSLLTAGVHLHTISCPNEAAFVRVKETLGSLGLLLNEE